MYSGGKAAVQIFRDCDQRPFGELREAFGGGERTGGQKKSGASRDVSVFALTGEPDGVFLPVW